MVNLTTGELDFFLNEMNQNHFEQTMFDEFHRETLNNLKTLRTEVDRITHVLDHQIACMEIRYKKIA
jgi:hypothetical protein